MQIIWFANDTELTPLSDGLVVRGRDLELARGVVPHQIVVNGYGYDYDGGNEYLLLYHRQHDQMKLTVLLGDLPPSDLSYLEGLTR